MKWQITHYTLSISFTRRYSTVLCGAVLYYTVFDRDDKHALTESREVMRGVHSNRELASVHCGCSNTAREQPDSIDDGTVTSGDMSSGSLSFSSSS